MPTRHDTNFAPPPEIDEKDELKARQSERAIEFYYQLLSAGRPLRDILATNLEVPDGPGPNGSDDIVASYFGNAALIPEQRPALALNETAKSNRESAVEPASGSSSELPRIARTAAESLPMEEEGLPSETRGRPPNWVTSLKHPSSVEEIGWFRPRRRRKFTRIIVLCFVSGSALAGAAIVAAFLVHPGREPRTAIKAAYRTIVRSLPTESSTNGPSAAERLPALQPQPARTAPTKLMPTAAVAPVTRGELTSKPVSSDAQNADRIAPGPPTPVAGVDKPTADKPDVSPQDGQHIAATLIAPAPPWQGEETHLSRSELEALLSRGDAFFSAGDLTSARLFYQHGANAGDGTAALRLGESYDPEFLQRAQLSQGRGDADQAGDWYRRAAELGNDDAQVVLDHMRHPDM